MSLRKVVLDTLKLPEFGLPQTEPLISADVYRQRMNQLRMRGEASGYALLMVYGDREHFANLTYLTGFDPRFEEALLIVNLRTDAKPLLLIGNEGFGYTAISPIKDDLEPVLFQSFSLLDQDRSQSRRLDQILHEAGVSTSTMVGVAGWKHFSAQENNHPATALEIPSYIVDTLRDIAGKDHVRNANGLLMSAQDGLRTINEVEQLARFEFAATFASQAIRNVLFGIKPGMTEFDAVGLMHLNGLPLSCHTMLSSGERAYMGLPSPSLKRLKHGEPVTTALGLWGALTSRAGFLVATEHELPAAIRDYADKLVAPYFEAAAAWYSHIGIGVAGGALYDLIHQRLGDPFFGVKLNPGHLIHLDEWVSSPVFQGSNIVLQSGMALQVDIIPATGTAYFASNIEDGIALADDALRAAFAHQYPEAWARIQARRSFMETELGIRLKPEVLPFSNIPAYLPPFWLNPGMAMRLA